MDKWALVSDFDGTISDDDFFYYASDRYLGKEALAPWDEYMQGKKAHFVALAEIYGSLRVDKAEMDAFIRKIRVDPHFEAVADYCAQKQIPLYICSAGCDYYINVRIGNLIDKYKIKVISNHGEYSTEKGLHLTPPAKDSPFYDSNIGVNKASIVKYLQNLGYKVVFCGDGMPDLRAAEAADKVFARKILLKQCQKLNIEAEKLIDFAQVKNFLQGENK